MINLNKSLDFFNPVDIKKTCHIIGIGAGGSHICEQLVRLGITRFTLYDFDTVTDHNIANQMFTQEDVKRNKVDAMKDYMLKINPDAQIKTVIEGWTPGTPLSGYVFLCLDNIEIRQLVVKENYLNNSIIAMFDFRMRLKDAQHYAADWKNEKHKLNFLKSMNFTHAEAQQETPVSACGTTLSVIPTLKILTAVGVSNFINFIKEQPLQTMILIDAFDYMLDAYSI